MPIREYPFTEILPGGTVRVRTAKARPHLWIRLSNPNTGQVFDTSAIVDTGADGCLFPADWALKLGYNLESVPPVEIGTANRVTHAYVHPTGVSILAILPDGHPDKTNVLYPVGIIPVAYTKGLDQLLLGRKDFLNRFVLVVHFSEQKFTLHLPQSYGKGKTASKVVRHHARRAVDRAGFPLATARCRGKGRPSVMSPVAPPVSLHFAGDDVTQDRRGVQLPRFP